MFFTRFYLSDVLQFLLCSYLNSEASLTKNIYYLFGIVSRILEIFLPFSVTYCSLYTDYMLTNPYVTGCLTSVHVPLSGENCSTIINVFLRSASIKPRGSFPSRDPTNNIAHLLNIDHIVSLYPAAYLICVGSGYSHDLRTTLVGKRISSYAHNPIPLLAVDLYIAL